MAESKIKGHPSKERIRHRSIMAQLWKRRQDLATRVQDDAVTITGETGLKAKRAKLLRTFRERRGFLLRLANQPSEATLGLLVKMHENHPADFPPLSRVSDISEGRDLEIELRKIKGAPFIMEASSFGITRENTEFLQPPESFCHCVRVLMNGYALESMSDPKGLEWCSLEAEHHHVSTVANLSRSNSKSAGPTHGRIVAADGAVRSERTRLGKAQTRISPTAIIDVISQRHAIWPLLSEFTRSVATRNMGWKGYPAQTGWRDKGKGAQ